METKKNIIEKYLDTKQKKIVAGCLAGVLVIGVAGAVILNNNGSKNLVLTSNEVDAEFGQKVSTNVADYLDANKVDNLDKIIKDTKEKDNLKYVTVTNKDEQGNVVSKEEKDYPKVGNYTINFTYKKEKQSITDVSAEQYLSNIQGIKTPTGKELLNIMHSDETYFLYIGYESCPYCREFSKTLSSFKTQNG